MTANVDDKIAVRKGGKRLKRSRGKPRTERMGAEGG